MLDAVVFYNWSTFFYFFQIRAIFRNNINSCLIRMVIYKIFKKPIAIIPCICASFHY